jgi:energy-coupling factor transporter transmembrane protein EcfT
MINTFAQVDYLASTGATVWHRASAVVKLAAAAALVGAAVFAPGWPALAVLLTAAVALVLTARLPLRLLFAAVATPLVFALVMAVATWSGDPARAATLLVRPVIAGVVALWLVGTTPYPDLFAPLSRVLPRAVGDGLFLTYRAVFALLSRIERLWKALFLRGALQGPVRRRAGMMGEAVGTVVLYGFERSHRLYQVMHLRGHSGRICGCRHWLELRREDAWVGGVLLAVLVASVVLTGTFRA